MTSSHEWNYCVWWENPEDLSPYQNRKHYLLVNLLVQLDVQLLCRYGTALGSVLGMMARDTIEGQSVPFQPGTVKKDGGGRGGSRDRVR